ncbi:uncharacterized protein LACBIDRAFT_316136 [Laccaria bicolor S238N-H82]|uniref:Predicted protein n=1 Tax=Laccaria bicolor (strain S238N-H82 / ATCC MYA-4686) TaxID=486041 RepID=B0D228_LACBS|nr:uncharacterized protein LACBIDRAFT_316136 [Laccaria bicolor S238N-H82]EDR11028.1 predicted protein [Laccaria bicolor S238N-H82]|eukprot:XP_001878329.1 predicted protein [Laccaria bicolor S238N-H82]
MALSIPRVTSTVEMSPAEARRTGGHFETVLNVHLLIYFEKRLWECAERKTRRSTGIDAVAILALLRSKANAFPLSIVIIEQYRPPIDKFIIELPAGRPRSSSLSIHHAHKLQGLIDEGETPEEAAFRELEEETGYKAHKVLEVSPVIVSDPGMTNANMKLVTLEVLLENSLELPEQKLEKGEFIINRVVELARLSEELKGNAFLPTVVPLLQEWYFV